MRRESRIDGGSRRSSGVIFTHLNAETVIGYDGASDRGSDVVFRALGVRRREVDETRPKRLTMFWCLTRYGDHVMRRRFDIARTNFFPHQGFS